MKNLINVPFDIWNTLDDGSLTLNANYELIEKDVITLREDILSLKNNIYSESACSDLTARCDVISQLANSGYEKVCDFNNYLLSTFTYQSENEKD